MDLTSRESEVVFRIMGELSAGHSSRDLRVCLCPLLRDLLNAEYLASYVWCEGQGRFADRVALMRDGRIHRTATPQQLRDDPQDAWTATFVGLGTVWRLGRAAQADQGAMDLDTPWGPLRLAANAGDRQLPEGEVCLLIRPEAVRLHRPVGVRATISDVRVAGDRTIATVQVPAAPPVDGYVAAGATPGQVCTISLDPAGVTLLQGE